MAMEEGPLLSEYLRAQHPDLQLRLSKALQNAAQRGEERRAKTYLQFGQPSAAAMAAEAGAGAITAREAGRGGLEFLPGAGINDYLQRGHKFWGEGADAAAAGDYGKMSSDWLQGLMSAGDASLDVAPLALGVAAPLGYAAVAGARRVPKMLSGFGEMMADTSGTARIPGMTGQTPGGGMLDMGILDTPVSEWPAPSYSPAERAVADMQTKFEAGNLDMTPNAVLKRLKNAAGAEIKAAGYDDARMLESLQGLIPEGSNSKHINPYDLEDFMAQNIYAPPLKRNWNVGPGTGQRTEWSLRDEAYDTRVESGYRTSDYDNMTINEHYVEAEELVWDADGDVDISDERITATVEEYIPTDDPEDLADFVADFRAEAGPDVDPRQVSMIDPADLRQGGIVPHGVTADTQQRMVPQQAPVVATMLSSNTGYLRASTRRAAIDAFEANPTHQRLAELEDAFGEDKFLEIAGQHSKHRVRDGNSGEVVNDDIASHNLALGHGQSHVQDQMPAPQEMSGPAVSDPVGHYDLDPDEVGDNVHWQQYALKGGEMYTEMTWQLEPGAPHAGNVQSWKTQGWTVDGSGDRWVVKNPAGVDASMWSTREAAEIDAAKYASRAGLFRSPHSYPQNTTYTFRGAEHQTEDGQTAFHFDEWQNDWVAKGEEEGWAGTINPEAQKAAETYLQEASENLKRHSARTIEEATGFHNQDALNFHLDSLGSRERAAAQRNALEKVDAVRQNDAAWSLAKERYNVAVREASRLDHAGVPKPPNIENWHKQALQQSIRWATEQGYDRITWTTGKQQIDRYDSAMRQNVDEISWTPAQSYEDGRSLVTVSAHKDGSTAYSGAYDAETGMSKDEFVLTQGGERKRHHLAKVIGKEQADKILTGGSGTIEGDDLTIGGRGLIAFYDDKMVNTAKKMCKQFGCTVSKTKIDAGPDGMQEVWTMDLTPKIKEKSAKGWARYAVPLAATAGAAAATQREDRPGI